MVNQEMFQRVNTMLTEFPELHDQTYWEEADTEATGSCGTTRCVAGWAVWLKALDLGLVSRKRDTVDTNMLHDVADHVGVPTEDEDGCEIGSGDLYELVGAKLLGLSQDDADNLFTDMNKHRVTRRVASYATTGKDISNEE